MVLFSKQGYERFRRYVSLLEERSRSLRKEIEETMGQTSETWHDNAPLDMVKETASQSNTILSDARKRLFSAEIISYPKRVTEVVEIGTCVDVVIGTDPLKYLLIAYGDENLDKNTLLYDSPLGRLLLGKKLYYSGEQNINGKNSSVFIRNISTLDDKFF